MLADTMVRHPPRPLATPPEPPRRYSVPVLPPYRHVPGLTPHPVKDPDGHLFGMAEAAPSSSCQNLPASWSRCPEYLYGVDLFNRAFLWEAHESWEMVWIGAGKTTAPARFVQGLIQISAALLRLHLDTPRGALNLLTRAREHLVVQERRLTGTGPSTYMGIAVEPWRRSVEEYLTAGSDTYPFLILEA